jgi:hypothetical protein
VKLANVTLNAGAGAITLSGKSSSNLASHAGVLLDNTTVTGGDVALTGANSTGDYGVALTNSTLNPTGTVNVQATEGIVKLDNSTVTHTASGGATSPSKP